MKIDGPNPVRGNAPVKKKDAASAAASTDFFSLISTDSVANSSGQPVGDIQPSTSLDALLTLQEMPDDERRAHEAIKHSQVTIDTLEKLRHALLMGTIPAHLLGELQAVVHHQQQQVSDPRLRAIMQDIELRASVELAKIERARVDENV